MALGCDARAAREDVQGHALAQEDLADRAVDCGAVGGLLSAGGGELVAFFYVPFDPFPLLVSRFLVPGGGGG